MQQGIIVYDRCLIAVALEVPIWMFLTLQQQIPSRMVESNRAVVGSCGYSFVVYIDYSTTITHKHPSFSPTKLTTSYGF
jgi:hypothetical protein